MKNLYVIDKVGVIYYFSKRTSCIGGHDNLLLGKISSKERVTLEVFRSTKQQKAINNAVRGEQQEENISEANINRKFKEVE